MFKLLILDFDGVILKSQDIKTQAFEKVFKNYPQRLGAIRGFHLKNAGVCRYNKFKHIYKMILKEPFNNKTCKHLDKIFSGFVWGRIKSCPFTKGARDFLARFSKKHKIYVVSGTPQKELRRIVKMRKIAGYLRGCFGGPQSKSFLIKCILKKEKLKKGEVLFVGDSLTDYLEAKKSGVRFIAYINGSSKPLFLNKNKMERIYSLNELGGFFPKRL